MRNRHVIKAAVLFAIATAIPFFAAMIWGSDDDMKNIVFVSSFSIYAIFIYFTVDALADAMKYKRSRANHPVLGVVMPRKDSDDAVLSDDKGVQ